MSGLSWPTPGATGWNTLVESNVNTLSSRVDNTDATVGALVPNTGSATGAALAAKYVDRGSRFYVKDPAYGAKGDGATIDTAAFTSALAACAAAGGGEVFVSGGPSTSYVVSGLSVPAGTSLIGRGAQLIGSSNGPIVGLVGNKARLSGLTITNTYVASGTITVNIASNVAYAKVDNCTIGGAKAQGIYAGATGISFLSVESCLFDGTNYGVLTNDGATDIHDVRVSDCTFVNQGADAIEFNHPSAPSAPYNFLVQGCHITTGGTAVSAGFGVGMAHVSRVSLLGNTFTDCKAQSIHVEDRSSDVTIIGNVINTTVTPAAGQISGGVYLFNTSDALIVGNRVKGVAGPGIILDYDPTHQNSNVTVTGNVVSNCTTGISAFCQTTLPSSYTIANNMVHDNTSDGIATSGPGISLTGNRSYNNGGNGFNTSGSHANNLIDDNIAFNNTLGDYHNASTTPVTVNNLRGYGSGNANSLANSDWVSLFDLGLAASGSLLVTGHSPNAATSGVRVLYTLTWDGTTLTTTVVKDFGNYGSLASLGLQMSGSTLQARAYNGGSTLTVTFEGYLDGSVVI